MSLAYTSSRLVRFPQSPQTGQLYLANNGVTYTWMAGGYWSGVQAIIDNTAEFYYDGEGADWAPNPTSHAGITLASDPAGAV